MRRFALVLCAVLALTWGASTASADTIGLTDFAFNANGTIYHGSLPGFANGAGFDLATGLGTITMDYRPGAGTFDFLAFFDHDITGLTNPFDDESAAVSGSPAAGQTWEMDEPGYTAGDLIPNLIAGTLDNMILDGTYNGPQDIAMAMGWQFVLGPDQRALITLNATTTAPTSGFYLHQYDSAGDIYLSGSLTTADIPSQTVPDASSTLWLLTSGLLGCWLSRLRRP